MDVLTDVLAATKIGGAVTACLRAAAPWGVHMGPEPTAAFHVITQGTCWLRLPDAQPRQLTAGDVVLLPTGGAHALSSDPTGPLTPYQDVLAGAPTDVATRIELPGDGPTTQLLCGAYRYDAHAAHPLLTLLPPVVHLPAGPAVSRQPLTDTLRLLAAELTTPHPGTQTIVDRLVDVLFVHILRAWLAGHADAGASWLTALHDPQVGKVIALIHEKPGTAWTVQSLAHAVGTSRATLARRFTAIVGEPPLAYLTRWRMELAARRLRDTAEPLSVIATHVGYTSEFAFSRAFTRARGVPPARYRTAERVGSER